MQKSSNVLASPEALAQAALIGVPLLIGAGKGLKRSLNQEDPSAVKGIAAPAVGAAGGLAGAAGGQAAGAILGGAAGGLSGAAIGGLAGLLPIGRMGKMPLLARLGRGSRLGAMAGMGLGGLGGALYGLGKGTMEGPDLLLDKMMDKRKEGSVNLEQEEKQAWAKLAYGGMSYPMSGALPQHMRSMKHGGTVKKTGPHYLHKGEEVIPADKAKKMRAEKKKAKKELAFSPKYDNNPRLKGGQSKLPDRIQKGILEKAAESRRNAILIKAALLSAAE